MSGLTCCRRHRAGIPLVTERCAIRCGDLDEADRDRLGDAAEELLARPQGCTSHEDMVALAAALLVALEQLAAVTAERDTLRAERVS